MPMPICQCQYAYAYMPMPICLCLYAYAYMPMPICLCLYAYAYMPMPICLCLYAYAYMHYKYLIWNGPVTAFKIATYSYHGTPHNIASLQFKYGKKWAPVRGEDREDMEWQEFELERGEYITQINHKSGSIIHSLQLVSNKRTFPTVGNGTNCPAKAGVIRISSGFPRFGYVTGYSTVWKGFRYVS